MKRLGVSATADAGDLRAQQHFARVITPSRLGPVGPPAPFQLTVRISMDGEAARALGWARPPVPSAGPDRRRSRTWRAKTPRPSRR